MTTKTKSTTTTEPVRRVHMVLTKREGQCILAAARAMRVPTALLLSTAALEAAHMLGYYEGHTAPWRPRPGLWPDAPRRLPSETATQRLTVSVAPIHLRTIDRAAREQLGEDYRLSLRGRPAPVHAFFIGAGLRYIAAHFQRARETAANSKASPDERQTAEKLIRAIEHGMENSKVPVLASYLETPRR